MWISISGIVTRIQKSSKNRAGGKELPSCSSWNKGNCSVKVFLSCATCMSRVCLSLNACKIFLASSFVSDSTSLCVVVPWLILESPSPVFPISSLIVPFISFAAAFLHFTKD